MENFISFPGLGIEFNINRVAFSLFGFDIYWYALIIATGIIIAYMYANAEGKRQGIDRDVFSDVLLIALPSAIVCARAYYVFTKWDYYGKNISEIFNLRGGGIAIYGAVIGALISVFIYCRLKKHNFLKLADIGAVGLLIGQSLGRWGNFVNVEAYGRETESFLRMGIISPETGKVIYVHPTFLYESVWNFAGIIIFAYLMRKKKADGQILWGYILWYGLGRFFIEGLRTDSLMVGNFRISQVVAAVSVLAGGALSIYYYLKTRKKTNEL